MTFPPPESFRPIRAGALPIFRQDHREYALFYAPGYLAAVELKQADAFEASLSQPAATTIGETALTGSSTPLALAVTQTMTWPAVVELRRHAAAAQQTWAEAHTRPFSPVCLMLYLNNECNLGCTYCYSNPSPRPGPRLELATVRAGAKLVAKNCRAQGQPFTLVFHGGGEPTLHQPLADRILNEVEGIAAAYDLPIFRYIATNGVMPPAKATWVAERFDLIGLSCDGPESLQNQQRPLWGGGSSSPFVERTAQAVREAGKPLHARVTITPQSLRRQSEIAAYVCQQLKPQEIHVEPIYKAGRARAEDCLTMDQVETFVEEFFKARAVARGYGIRWLMSGSRPGEIHGPYCHVFREVLNLVPGGAATACFKTTTAVQTRQQEVMVGEMEAASGCFSLDHDHIQSLRQALRLFPGKCGNCFNQYHCVRDCPDHCPLEGVRPSSEFGCQAQKKLVNALLQETAEALRITGTFVAGVVSGEVIVS